MAAPITHIVLTDKVFAKEFPMFSEEKFFIGTSFPDIRYLGVIERNKTHFTNPSLKCIKSENDVKAGMMFHSLVDEVREKFIEENKVYKIIPRNDISIQSLKLFEDEILYNKIENWNSIASYFDSILPEESTYTIKTEEIERWHNTLKLYFAQKPNIKSREILFKEMNFNDGQRMQIEENISDMRRNDGLANIIASFYDEFGENNF